MSQIYCKYHYDLPARWSCKRCNINYCTNCVKGQSSIAPVCVVCGQPLDVLSAENVVVPFWQRLHKFFSFPFSTVPIAILIMLTTIITALGDTLFGFVINILCILAFMKYAYVTLEDTSQGYLKPKPFDSTMITHELELPFKQIIILFLLAGLNFAIYDFVGKDSAYLATTLTVFLLPASIMVLSVKHTFFSAFDIRLLAHVLKNVGWAYLLLYVMLLLLLSSAGATLMYIHLFLPEAFQTGAGVLAFMYFTLIMFNMMGYALYQYHEKLGFDVAVEVSSNQDLKRSGADNQDIDTSLADVEILVVEGRYLQAIEALQQKIAVFPSDTRVRTYLQKLLTILGKDKLAREHCADYVGRLMSEKQMAFAMKVFESCYKADSRVTLNKPTERLELAKLFKNNGQLKIALVLLNNLHKQHPSYSEIPEAYLIAAQLMSEQFNQDDKARRILKYVLANYPEHRCIDEVRQYLNMIEDVARMDQHNAAT